jgi:hypothetical protein
VINGELIAIYEDGELSVSKSTALRATNVNCDINTLPHYLPTRLEDGFYPHPDCPNLYYQVQNGYAFLFNCFAGLVWNEITCTCDYKDNVSFWNGLTSADAVGAWAGAVGGVLASLITVGVSIPAAAIGGGVGASASYAFL